METNVIINVPKREEKQKARPDTKKDQSPRRIFTNCRPFRSIILLSPFFQIIVEETPNFQPHFSIQLRNCQPVDPRDVLIFTGSGRFISAVKHAGRFVRLINGN